MKSIAYIAATAIISLSACKSMQTNSITAADFPAFSTEAHRGGRGLMPENTIIAMKDAVDRGVTTLEMDTHISSDGQVVLSHDDYVNPLFTLTPEGKDISKAEAENLILYKMSYADLKKYDVGSKFYSKFPQQKKVKTYMPLLAEVIDEVQAHTKAQGKKQLFYNIETKCDAAGDGKYNPKPEVFVKLLMDVIEQKKITPYVVIQSFDKRTIQIIHQKYPQVRTSYLIENKKSFEENIKELGYKPFIYSPAFKLVTADLVAKCHAQGIKVLPWTVNTAEEIVRLKGLNVDGIITDYPNLF